MNKIIKSALAALSKQDVDLKTNYEQARQFQKASRPYVKSVVCNMMERVLRIDGREVLTRAFSHTGKVAPIMIFFHGGGFVTGDFDSYSNICANLSKATGRKIISVDYRLAPEHKFPAGPEDCCEAARQIIAHAWDWYQADPDDVILIGDSAGATLSCVVSMMLRDRGEKMPAGQVLVYPAAWCDYTEASPFLSVSENGEEYLLTRRQLIDYMELYASSPEDYKNPYFAPLRHTDFSGLPRTLILTMEFDPLRDEGEALGEKLKEAGCDVSVKRLENGIHGLLALPMSAPLTRDLFCWIGEFVHNEAGNA